RSAHLRRDLSRALSRALLPRIERRLASARMRGVIAAAWPSAITLFLLHEKDELAVRRVGRQKRVARLFGKRLKILDRPGIGGENLQHLARGHVAQGFLGAQDRKRAIQASGVEFLVEIHGP